jgi:uncharacterized membrane protein
MPLYKTPCAFAPRTFDGVVMNDVAVVLVVSLLLALFVRIFWRLIVNLLVIMVISLIFAAVFFVDLGIGQVYGRV